MSAARLKAAAIATAPALRARSVCPHRGQGPPSNSKGAARSHTVQEIAGAPGGSLRSGAILRQRVRRSSSARVRIARIAAAMKQAPPVPTWTVRCSETRTIPMMKPNRKTSGMAQRSSSMTQRFSRPSQGGRRPKTRAPSTTLSPA